ncbi:MAG: hypothetical protein RJB12_891, partial [Pseudomonadota bacterium]
SIHPIDDPLRSLPLRSYLSGSGRSGEIDVARNDHRRPGRPRHLGPDGAESFCKGDTASLCLRQRSAKRPLRVVGSTGEGEKRTSESDQVRNALQSISERHFNVACRQVDGHDGSSGRSRLRGEVKIEHPELPILLLPTKIQRTGGLHISKRRVPSLRSRPFARHPHHFRRERWATKGFRTGRGAASQKTYRSNERLEDHGRSLLSVTHGHRTRVVCEMSALGRERPVACGRKADSRLTARDCGLQPCDQLVEQGGSPPSSQHSTKAGRRE